MTREFADARRVSLAGIIAAPLCRSLSDAGRTRQGPQGTGPPPAGFVLGLGRHRWCLPLAEQNMWRWCEAARLFRTQADPRRSPPGGGASLVWLPSTRRWTAPRPPLLATSVFLFVAYLAYALTGTITIHSGPAARPAAWCCAVRAVPAVMSCASLLLDCRRAGHRATAQFLPQPRNQASWPTTRPAMSASRQRPQRSRPMVNKETLRSLRALTNTRALPRSVIERQHRD